MSSLDMINTPALSNIKTYKLPYCIQCTDTPAFRGILATGDYLRCSSGCGQILIEHYDKNNYASIGIRCFRCGEITWIPGIPLGEVFAGRAKSLNNISEDRKVFFLWGTVNVPPGVVVTCDQEIKLEIETTAPRQTSFLLELTPAGLESLVKEYDHIIRGKYQIQKERVKKLGASSIKIYPFAWSIAHLWECILTGGIDIRRKETVTALMWVQTFVHVLGTWRHHPRFHIVAKDLGKPRSFLHTSALLIAASYLYRAGNRVGFSLENLEGQPNPDLYLPGLGDGKVYLEVKAPEALQWGSDETSLEKIEAVVLNTIKDSKDQINRTHRGVLVMFSSYANKHFPELFEKYIQKALMTIGKKRKYLAAVVGISPEEITFSTQGNMQISFRFCTTLNEYYDGTNPIVTKASE